MATKYIHIVLIIFIIGLCQHSIGQSNNPITIGDAINDFNTSTENLGTENNRTGYLTWDATNIYIGIEGNPIVSQLANLWVVIDTDPTTTDDPRNGNGRTDQPNNESGGATYPFAADVIYKFHGAGADDPSIQNPADGEKWTISSGNWSSASIASGVRIYRQSSSITDIEIPFSDIGISSGDEFNIVIYVANFDTDPGSTNFLQFPTNNPNRHAPTDGNSDPITHYYTFNRTTGVTTNSTDHLSIRTYATGFTFGESSLAYLSLIGGGQTYSCGALTSITRNLYIGSGVTFQMGTNIAALSVNKNVINVGTFTLSNAVGGDLSVGGDWTNTGTFTDNARQTTFNGSSNQTLTSTSGETFSYLALDKSGGNLILANNVTASSRLQFNLGNTGDITTSNSSTLTISNDVADDASNGIVRNGDGMVLTTLIRNIGTSTGTRLFPTGNGSDYRALTLSVGSAPTTGGTVTLTYTHLNSTTDVNINDGGTTLFRLSDSNWDLSTTTLAGGSYNLTLRGDGLSVTDVDHLRVSLASSVIATHSAGAGTTSNPEANRTSLTQTNLNNTFYIATTSLASPLPVEWLDFYGKVNNNQIELNWSTATEKNNDYFEIQKSTNGNVFEKIGVMHGAGNSLTSQRYKWIDNEPNNGNNYYRLKQVDFNGDFSYSKIINVSFQKTIDIKLYPNPVHDILNISYNFEYSNREMKIEIYNTTGKLIEELPITQSIQIAHLQSGMYYLNVVDSAQKPIFQQRFIKL